ATVQPPDNGDEPKQTDYNARCVAAKLYAFYTSTSISTERQDSIARRFYELVFNHIATSNNTNITREDLSRVAAFTAPSDDES
ncbi:hypothetical protein HK102_012525, partial [Quaeritorhiza haematococci]